MLDKLRGFFPASKKLSEQKASIKEQAEGERLDKKFDELKTAAVSALKNLEDFKIEKLGFPDTRPKPKKPLANEADYSYREAPLNTEVMQSNQEEYSRAGYDALSQDYEILDEINDKELKEHRERAKNMEIEPGSDMSASETEELLDKVYYVKHLRNLLDKIYLKGKKEAIKYNAEYDKLLKTAEAAVSKLEKFKAEKLGSKPATPE